MRYFWAKSGGRKVYAALLAWGLGVASAGAVLYSVSFSTLDNPGARYGNSANGINGLLVVGQYSDGSHLLHGYITNGSNFTDLDDPDGISTNPRDTDGQYVVGSYADSNHVNHGFYYDGSTFTTLDYPGSAYTVATSIAGGVIAGTYVMANGATHGFLYDADGFVPYDTPLGANHTTITGTDGGRIVGYYVDAGSHAHAYVYGVNSGFQTVDPPLATYGATFTAISGNLIAGYYSLPTGVHGFLYDGVTFTPLDVPGGGNLTEPLGISGGLVVGFYNDAQGGAHGFVAAVSPTPLIKVQPLNAAVAVGKAANFTVTAVGAGTVTYQWEYNGNIIKGATKPTYSIPKVAIANAGNYTVVVANAGGPTTSHAALLTVLAPVKITTQPKSQIVSKGGGVMFSVAGTGTGPFGFQWQFSSNGKTYVNIGGATGISYTVLNAQAINAGSYRVVVTNVMGSVTSAVAKLTVKK